ncbi:outer membrane beta-barrel protein [Sediminibacter sp. Hel_I_10]|uniref:outer membrane beta-barrel protein n=1 Tax=Sediminibacter sp. Hel_I_10 TaxID=1392490 RepID=UPI00047A1A27|nr:outer membrane beta-barrel protein [Sediminibacter sp. Hel_I_10]
MKKNLVVTAVLVLSIFNGFSQSQKNDLKLTLSALPLFGSSEGFKSGIIGIVVKPAIGYFISNNTSIDINFSYATLKDLKVGSVDSYYNSYAFVPTLRHHFLNKQKLRVFGEFGFGLGTIKYDADDDELRNSQHSDLSGGISVLNIGVGANYFFNEKLGLEIIIPYINSKNITSNKADNLYSGVGPTLGLAYVLN